jgi:CheY-like chemotaxis protein
MMPHRDGWEVLHELKADPATAGIPVIIVSVVDNKDLGYRLGAYDYLVKPFDRGAIVETLRRISTSPLQRILVVDDDPDVIDMVQQLLEGEPYEVIAARDGHLALEVVAARRPDVVLLDLLMPGLDGFGVIEHLRHDAATRNVPIIVLTAKTLTGSEQALLDQTVVKVVRKMGLERGAFIQDLRAALGSRLPQESEP